MNSSMKRGVKLHFLAKEMGEVNEVSGEEMSRFSGVLTWGTCELTWGMSRFSGVLTLGTCERTWGMCELT